MKTILLAALAALAGACGSGSARRGPPEAPAPKLATAEDRVGQTLFFEYCNPCHPGGEAGLGPSLNDKPLPGPAIRLMVREGLGAMPSFSHRALGDKALDAIVSYIHELHKAPTG